MDDNIFGPSKKEAMDYVVNRVTRKDFKQSDYAKNRRPDITIGV